MSAITGLTGWLWPHQKNSNRLFFVLFTSPGSNHHILFINQHYWPDVAATGQNLTDLAEFLAAKGWNITVITSRSNYESGRLKVPLKEHKNGVTIYRVPATSFGRSSNTGRIIDYLSFILSATITTLRFLKKTTMVITLTTPPFIGCIGRLAQLFGSTRHIIWSMDLHPEAEISLGMFKARSMLARFLLGLNNHIFMAADGIVTLGNCMSQRLVKQYNIDAQKIHLIRIWSNGDTIKPLPQKSGLSYLPVNFRNRFIVHYSGNLGLVHSFDTMCRIMLELSGDESVGFIFQGDGPRKTEVKNFVSKHHLGNVAFLPYVPRTELNISLAKAHIHWLSLRPALTGVAVPAKTYGYMASGRPVLFIGKSASDSGEDITQAGAGYIIEPGQVKKGVDYIKMLQRNEKLRNELGRNGRRFILTYSDKPVCCNQWFDLLSTL